MKTIELRKKDKKELEKTVHGNAKKLSDLRFKFSSGKLKNVKEIANLKKETARILTILKETLGRSNTGEAK
jgi:ribosomal protein L29